jgi:hypothetical protein
MLICPIHGFQQGIRIGIADAKLGEVCTLPSTADLFELGILSGFLVVYARTGHDDA